MTGTVVQLSFRALRYDWPGLTGQGGLMSDRAVCGCFRVSVCALQYRRGRQGITSQTSQSLSRVALSLHISLTCCDLSQPTGVWV